MSDPLLDHVGRLWRRQHDTRAAIELSRLGLPFTAWSRSALAPAALLTVINDVIINRRRFVAELGAGISTVYLGRVLQLHGGRLVSVESDPAWAALVREMLASSGIPPAVATVTHVPLASCRYSLDGAPWYAEETISAALGDETIDLLLVDGPPAHRAGSRLARYPAIPMLKSHLGSRYAVYLDDIGRPGERRIARMWARELGVPFQHQHLTSGMAVAQAGDRLFSFL